MEVFQNPMNWLYLVAISLAILLLAKAVKRFEDAVKAKKGCCAADNKEAASAEPASTESAS